MDHRTPEMIAEILAAADHCSRSNMPEFGPDHECDECHALADEVNRLQKLINDVESVGWGFCPWCECGTGHIDCPAFEDTDK